MVFARISLSDYANKVLNVIKARFELKDKSEAIDKFIKMFGEEIVEQEASDEYIKGLLEIEKTHFKKHGYKIMSKNEFNKLFELK